MKPTRLLAYLVPFRSRFSLNPRVFSFKSFRCLEFSASKDSLMHFGFRSSGFTEPSPPSSPSHADHGPPKNSDLRNSLPYSIFRLRAPSTHPSQDVWEEFAFPPRSSTLRVWLPFQWLLRLRALESFFQPPTLIGFTLQSFLSGEEIQKKFPSLVSVHALFPETFQPTDGASTASSFIPSSSPLTQLQVISLKRGLLLS